jgi:predicted GNAT superfamily acetyltransferase
MSGGSIQQILEIRPLRTTEEFQECVRLQKRTWGEDFSERVPLAILKVGPRIGGITAGAFDAAGTLLGFVFGLTGVEKGRLVHWSDMLAVVPEARNQGLGRRLKEYQRAELMKLGVEVVYWTFDPLVARNAHLNLRVLGARVAEYVVDMYGADTASDLQRGLGTDRFVVAWDLAKGGTHIETARTEVPNLVRAAAGGPVTDLTPLSDPPPRIAIQIPPDIERVQNDSVERAAHWRQATRQAFTAAFERGYHVSSFDSPEDGGPARYFLHREL